MRKLDFTKFPTTRYQGSKRKLLPELNSLFSKLDFDTAIDLFSGSGSVSYLLRNIGKTVSANDFLKYNENTAKLFLSKIQKNDLDKAKSSLNTLLTTIPNDSKKYIEKGYRGVFFTNDENIQIDNFAQNIKRLPKKQQIILIYAVGQALLKKRPYNLFHRANLNVRLANVKRSFGNKKTWDTAIVDHATKAIDELYLLDLTQLPQGSSTCINACDFKTLPQADLIYLDPPYVDGKGSAIDYSDFYGFLDGLLDYENFNNISKKAPHKPIKLLESKWRTTASTLEELSKMIAHWEKSIFVISYRDDSEISAKEFKEIFKKTHTVQYENLSTYQYALSKKSCSEVVVIGIPKGVK